jgi:hypothetical protein
MYLRIEVPIWKHSVIVSVCQTDKEFRERFVQEFANDDVEENLKLLMTNGNEIAYYDTDGRTIVTPFGTVIIRSRIDLATPYGVGVMVHELFHAASAILHRKGVLFSEASEEAFTYLLEFLTRQVFAHFSTLPKLETNDE